MTCLAPGPLTQQDNAYNEIVLEEHHLDAEYSNTVNCDSIARQNS